jgi:hypothetical protein
MTAKKKKPIAPFADEEVAEYYRALDALSVDSDGKPRSQFRQMLALLAAEQDFAGQHAERFAAIFELVQKELCRTSADEESFSDVVHLAFLLGAIFRGSDAELEKQFAGKIGARGASSRHKETNSMKASVFAWLDQNRTKYKSMEKAAEQIILNEPITFRTAKEWGAAWKKERANAKPDSKKD